MNLLLTGSTGFLGAHLVRRLARESSVRLGLLIRPFSDRARLPHLPANAVMITGDLENLTDARDAIVAFRPDAVVHSAWFGVGNKQRNDPLQIDRNLVPTLDLLKIAAAAGAKHFIGVGSQAEYGPANQRISENHPTHPTTLYGATKLASCVLCERLSAELGLRFAWLRVFSTYGPMEDPGWLIPYLTQSLLRRERPSLTACEQLWDYVYGPDAADAIWDVTRTATATGVFNLGSGQAVLLRSIVEQIRDLVDRSLPLGIGEVPYRPDQVMHLEADVTRLRQATGWQPRTTLADGLSATVEYWRSRLA